MRNSLMEILADSAGYKAVEGETVRSIVGTGQHCSRSNTLDYALHPAHVPSSAFPPKHGSRPSGGKKGFERLITPTLPLRCQYAGVALGCSWD